MLDLQHILQQTSSDVQLFYGMSTVTNVQWRTWVKPRRASWVFMAGMSSGGGGGGGLTRAAGNAGGGGGGGGGSGITTVLMPAWALPDRLFIQSCYGGVGSSGSGVGGTAGVLSYVCVYPDTAASNCVLVSGAAAPTGGGAGTAGAAGTAGSAGTIATLAAMPLSAMGFRNFIAGQAGTAAGAVSGAVGVAQSIPVTGIISMGGTGGGSTTSANFAGGAITSIASSLLSDLRPINAAAGTFDGPGGYLLLPPGGPFWSYPGLGGGASNTAAGGKGGPGAPGSGGGGGGAGTTGGRGGDGGPGLVLIQTW